MTDEYDSSLYSSDDDTAGKPYAHPESAPVDAPKTIVIKKIALSEDGEYTYLLVTPPNPTPTLVNYLKTVAKYEPTWMSGPGWVFYAAQLSSVMNGLSFRGYKVTEEETVVPVLPTEPLKSRRDSAKWVAKLSAFESSAGVDSESDSSDSEPEVRDASHSEQSVDLPEKNSPSSVPAKTEQELGVYPNRQAHGTIRARIGSSIDSPTVERSVESFVESKVLGSPAKGQTDGFLERDLPIEAPKARRAPPRPRRTVCKKVMVSTGRDCKKRVHKYGMCSYHISQWTKAHVWGRAAGMRPC